MTPSDFTKIKKQIRILAEQHDIDTITDIMRVCVSEIERQVDEGQYPHQEQRLHDANDVIDRLVHTFDLEPQE